MAQDRYRVVRRLDAGGMAEVYLGEAESLQGFTKKVAIKRVLPELAQNRQFIRMFLDEARIGLHLNHANVVQVFDIGNSNDTYFIVMEYVDGVNLKTIVEATRSRGRPAPVPVSVYMMIEVCKALSYAHELTDESGRSRGIVHRDVSPPNVLLSKRGEVKLVDFGLAKAVDQLEHTDPGVIKGKFSYLSPEAVEQKEVDSRADIFAVGILLWELLTNERLFLGETDLDTIELVKRAHVPSIINLNPQVPPPLEQVVRRALARDRNMRYQSAREIGDALADVLFTHQLKVTNFDIGSLVNEIVQQDNFSKREPSRIEKLIEEELLRFTTLDETNVPQALSPELEYIDPQHGAQPLDGSSFEDPRQWAGELLGEDAPRRHEPSGGHEAIPMAQPGLQPGELAHALESELYNDPEPTKTPAASTGSIAMKVVLAVLIVALLGVGAAIALLLLNN
jgi:eukaryotic-like serine/threonine-protein kinase